MRNRRPPDNPPLAHFRYRRRLALTPIVLVALLAPPLGAADAEIVSATGDAAGQWPGWRGPSGQGVAVGTGFPDRWSPDRNVLWKVEVPGRGHSSPVIWDDQIFLTTAYDDGQRRSILSFDRGNGERLWETFAPPADPERAYPKNSHASSTVATDGERVYAYFGNHGLLAVDLSGKQVWHQSFGDVSSRHGTGGSPLLFDDKVILYHDNQGPGGSFIAAFDKRGGEPLWRTARPHRVGWGTPIAVRVGDHAEIVVSGEGRVYGYDPDSGKELWSCAGNLSEVTPTPVVGEGLVFCASGRAGPTLAIRPGGRGDVSDSHLAWKASKGSPFVPSPLYYDGILYTVNDMMSVATAYRARDGKLLWQGRLGQARREGFSASPVVADGKIFFTNDDGTTFVLAPGDEFEILAQNELGEATLATPAALDGKWYFRTVDHLVCIGAPADAAAPTGAGP